MSRKRIPACIAAFFALAGICRGADEQAVGEDAHCGVWNRQTLTNGFCGLNDSLGDTGIEFGLAPRAFISRMFAAASAGIANPGGSSAVSDAVVLGVRAQMLF
jgi:hypothetical protein